MPSSTGSGLSPDLGWSSTLAESGVVPGIESMHAGHSHEGQNHTHDGHGHSHSAAGANEGRLRLVLAATAVFMVVEVITGLITNSLSMLADAGHMLADVAGVTFALIAIHFARRPA